MQPSEARSLRLPHFPMRAKPSSFRYYNTMYFRPLFFTALITCGATLLASAQGRVRAETSPVRVQAAESRLHVDRVEALGAIQARESITITAKVSDFITRIHFQDGQEVEAGTVLVELLNARETAQLDEAKAAVDEARRQLERIEPLIEIGAAPSSLFDERQREYDVAMARFRIIEATLADRVITAPFAGRLGLRSVSPGAFVNPGQPIATLDDLSVMRLDISIPSIFLSSIHPQAEVRARSRDLPGREFIGQVQTVDTRIDPISRSILVRAILPNEDRLLRPGRLMVVDILKDQREAVFIPEIAVIAIGREHFVFKIVDTDSGPIAREQQVTVGTRLPGERFVTAGVSRLRDGSPVTIQSALTTKAQGGSLSQSLP